jgi:hypothetical protein
VAVGGAIGFATLTTIIAINAGSWCDILKSGLQGAIMVGIFLGIGDLLLPDEMFGSLASSIRQDNRSRREVRHARFSRRAAEHGTGGGLQEWVHPDPLRAVLWAKMLTPVCRTQAQDGAFHSFSID